MNTITIELCAEDRARLDAIIAALEKAPSKSKPKTTKAEPTPEPTPEAELPTCPPPEPTPEKEPEVDLKELRGKVQRKVVELCAAGKKTEVKEIVTAYATQVSNIPDEMLLEVMVKLSQLEG